MNKKLWGWTLGFLLLFIVGVSATYYPEPFVSNMDANNYNLTGADEISANTFRGTDLFVNNIMGNPTWCYQETANETSSCGGLATGLYTNSSALNWTNNSWVYDGNFSSSTSFNGTQNSIGFININYTKPGAALNESLWLIKRASAINNYSIEAGCWNYADTLVLRGVVQNSSLNVTSNYWQCYNGTSYQNVTASQTGALLFEEAMNWKMSSNTNMNWTSLSSYPAACPGSSAITQLGDSVICSDLWVDTAGGIVNGNLTVNGSSILQLNMNTTTIACDETTAGAIYYNNDSLVHYGCNVSGWQALY